VDLLQLDIEHLGPIRHASLKFGPGLTGILGPIGCGKSHVIKIIQWLLTGDFKGYGTQVRRIYKQEDKGAATLTFSHLGMPGTLTRSLSRSGGSSRSLRFGDKTARSEAAVAEVLADILGASSKQLDTAVFIPQGETARLLSARPSERETALTRLFGLENCETLRTLISTSLQLTPPPSVIMGIELLPQQLQQLTAQIEQATKELEGLPPVDGQKLKEDEALVREAENMTLRLADAKTGLWAMTEAEVRANLERANSAERSESAVLASLNLRKQVEEIAPMAQEARALLESAGRAAKLHAELESHTSRVAAARTRVDKLKTMEPPEPEDQDAAWQKLETEVIIPAEQSMLSLERFAQSFAKGVCPTCGTRAIVDQDGQLTNLETKVKENRDQAATLRKEVAEGRKMLAEYRATVLAGRQKRRGWETSMAQAQSLSQQMAAAEAAASQATADVQQMSAEDRKSCEDLLAREKSLQQAAARAQQAVATTGADQARAEAEYTAVDKALEVLAEVQASLASAKYVGWDKKKEELAQISATVAKRAGLQAKLGEWQKQVTDMGQRLAKAKEAEAASAGVVHYRDILNRTYGVLHRSAYPTARIRHSLSRLNRSWNELLSMVDVPFTIGVNPDLSMTAKFGWGEQAIEELSGGQLCCAAICLLCTVHRQCASNIRFMCLDEPTYGLNAAHVVKVRDMLAAVSGYAKTQGLQMLMITHDERFSSAFDQCIDMGQIQAVAG